MIPSCQRVQGVGLAGCFGKGVGKSVQPVYSFVLHMVPKILSLPLLFLVNSYSFLDNFINVTSSVMSFPAPPGRIHLFFLECSGVLHTGFHTVHGPLKDLAGFSFSPLRFES